MKDTKNNVPQFVACGLEMGNCPRQIPYDMAEHERIIMADLLDKVWKKVISKDEDYLYLSEIREIITKMKAEVNE